MNGINKFSIFALVAGVLAAGCGSAAEPTEDLTQSASAVIGTDTFLYFQSNATGWGVDDNTRLFPFVGFWARTINVNQAWEVTDGDSAIVTETNQLNGWGTKQTFSGVASKLLTEPATTPLTVQTPGTDLHFRVKYSALGQHRVVVDTTVSPAAITIQPITCPACPSSLHCVIQQNSQPTCL